MTDITEKIYSTPRTYGSPTGHDREMSHLPNWRARIAEQMVHSMLMGGALTDPVSLPLVASRSCNLAAALVDEFDKRGWFVEVVPAPDLDANYGKRRDKQ